MAALQMLRAKLNPDPIPSDSFAGKTIIVTGSNVGLGLSVGEFVDDHSLTDNLKLGLETARNFVRLGCAKIILAVRNIQKGEEARHDIEGTTSRDGVIQVWQLDMGSFQSVKSFADKVDAELERVDVALLNAGLMSRTFVMSPEGFEETLQVNVLATALLALLLLPKLRASKTPDSMPHLGIVGSGTHARSSFIQQNNSHILQALNVEDGYDGRIQYSVSKLFVMYIVDEIANLVTSQNGEPEVIVTATCPGFCSSDLGRQFDKWYEKAFMSIFSLIFARSTEEGSRTLVGSVTQGVESNGKYWKNAKITPPGPLVETEEGERLRQQIWREIGDILKAKVPEVGQYF